MRGIMPCLFEPLVSALDATPDGWREVLIEVNGHRVTTVVCPPDDGTHLRSFLLQVRSAILQRC